MSLEIVETPPDHPDAVQLIAELEALLSPNYPATSRHGYSVEKLLREKVAFFVAYCDRSPAACGGVQLFGQEYAEVKRMYVRPQFRGQGLGKHILDHLADYSRQHEVTLFRLETGIYQVEAIALYERYGFQRIPPFGNYHEDPLSLCYEMGL